MGQKQKKSVVVKKLVDKAKMERIAIQKIRGSREKKSRKHVRKAQGNAGHEGKRE